MVERRAQSPDVDKLPVKLEAAIRKGVPLDIPKAAISLFENMKNCLLTRGSAFSGPGSRLLEGITEAWTLNWHGRS